MICLGHEGAIQNLMVNHTIKRACLMRNFQSHPVLVEALSTAAYNHQLLPALSERDRMMRRLLGFSVRIVDIPVLLSHTSGREHLTSERSWSNDLHNEVAVKMRRYILERLPEANITILCYDSASLKRIAALELGCQVYSINRYKRQECEFSLIVTSRVGMERERWNVNFILDAPRTTVALSRA